MPISKNEREAYENGKAEAKYISDNPIEYVVGGGIHDRPSNKSEREAYGKGLADKQLDED